MDKKNRELVEDETNRVYVRTTEHPTGELFTGKEVSDWHYKEIEKAIEAERQRIVKELSKPD